MLGRNAARRVFAIPRRGFALPGGPPSGTSIPQGVPAASTRYVQDQVREISPPAPARVHRPTRTRRGGWGDLPPLRAS